jgi:hypothetical protein
MPQLRGNEPILGLNIRVKCTRLSTSHTEERKNSQELRIEIFGARRAGDIK